jgi:tRNA dimethylallyltransferase
MSSFLSTSSGGKPPLPIVILTGPTGAGKSDWAMRLASELPLEIISVDSAQVYRGLDIGTAKPTAEERERVPHHLLDIRDPAETYSAGQFVSDAKRLITEIRTRNRLPLLVGGTMLYLRALLRGIADLPQGSAELRQSIDERGAREGWPALHAELARLDPEAAARIHPNDPQRIQRALEVFHLVQRPLSELQRATTHSALEEAVPLRWAIVPADRSQLHSRIEYRFRSMMSQGFLDEVARLYRRGDLTADHPSIRAVGYRQLWAYLSGQTALDEAINRSISATRQLAKRQLTWLRADKEIRWVDSQATDAYERWNCDLRRELKELGCFS